MVQRVEPRVVRVELGKATGIIPQSEQIQGEFYKIGSRIKVLIKDIEREGRQCDVSSDAWVRWPSLQFQQRQTAPASSR